MSETCADARCEHPKGWHRCGIGSCLECGCVAFKPKPLTLLVGKHPKPVDGNVAALHD